MRPERHLHTHHQTKENPVAQALREAGFIPLPRLWVKPEDMEEIHRIADKHRTTVNNIRGKINAGEETVAADPVHNKDAAWEAYERMRNNG